MLMPVGLNSLSRVVPVLVTALFAVTIGGCVISDPYDPAPARVYTPPPRNYDPPPPPQQAYPPPQTYDSPRGYDQQGYEQPRSDQEYSQGEPSRAEGQWRAYEAPPPLPYYEQPPCPEPDYLWMPGYWGFGGGGYYWIPGTWVSPPQVGFLWTPGYWGWGEGAFLFHVGYWGAHVGFYGGVNYGGGYIGSGYAGGRWVNNRFAYNTAVNNVNTTIINNTYHETVINNVTINNVSYNGGAGGITAVPTPHERVIARDPHIQATIQQVQHAQAASVNPAMLVTTNQGRPSIAATPRAGAFNSPNVVGARGAVPGGRGNPAVRGDAYGNGNPPRSNPGVTSGGVTVLRPAETRGVQAAPQPVAPAPRPMQPAPVRFPQNGNTPPVYRAPDAQRAERVQAPARPPVYERPQAPPQAQPPRQPQPQFSRPPAYERPQAPPQAQPQFVRPPAAVAPPPQQARPAPPPQAQPPQQPKPANPQDRRREDRENNR